jgi:hypothetical protein
MTDEQKQADTALEVHVCGLGFKWGGDVWEIEDANLHPAIRAIEAAAVAPLMERIAALDRLAETLKLEAQLHAQEARTANATIAEIYQLCSGGTGEPGNWHGAEPIRPS